MSTGANIYYRYGKGSPKERVDLIYVNYLQFKSIIEGCKSKLIYEIEAEKEYIHRKDLGDLGVRVQTTGHYSDRTCNQAIAKVILEDELGQEELSDGTLKGLEDSEEFIYKHRVLRMMQREYRCFDGQLHMLPIESQRIILPYLMHEKDYVQIADELGITVESVRKRVYRIRKELVMELADNFIESL